MNLVKEPWIPVVMQDGKPARVSLRDAFAKGEDIADLAANPCQRIALMRLLICVAQAALDGPKDEEDWLACKPRLVPAVLSYLDTWQHRFNLFGEHAFLQVDGL
ncbi:MAG TPA: type I-E CRISPR-associated protein Cse1/CasA, partial [Kiritimatiellia bacterium]|nr:type I-E CRISPR-associated protein Cse1/CasA [Kiritimatiellia bacterium]